MLGCGLVHHHPDPTPVVWVVVRTRCRAGVRGTDQGALQVEGLGVLEEQHDVPLQVGQAAVPVASDLLLQPNNTPPCTRAAAV